MNYQQEKIVAKMYYTMNGLYQVQCVQLRLKAVVSGPISHYWSIYRLIDFNNSSSLRC